MPGSFMRNNSQESILLFSVRKWWGFNGLLNGEYYVRVSDFSHFLVEVMVYHLRIIMASINYSGKKVKKQMKLDSDYISHWGTSLEDIGSEKSSQMQVIIAFFLSVIILT
jgi:hypothetical protein